MWDVGGLQVHRIGSRRLLYKEVVEVRSNYKKSYFWWFGNLIWEFARGESTESNRIEKYQGRVSARLLWRHILSLWKKEDKLHALSRDSKYMTLNKRRIFMESFIISQFNYCPLIWMIHSRGLNNKINRIHERALRIVYDDNRSSFEDLLNKDKSVTIHQRNLQQLAI